MTPTTNRDVSRYVRILLAIRNFGLLLAGVSIGVLASEVALYLTHNLPF
jgi:hypothetical protein